MDAVPRDHGRGDGAGVADVLDAGARRRRAGDPGEWPAVSRHYLAPARRGAADPYDLPSRCRRPLGTGPSITVAATARSPRPGGVLTIAPDQTADWLAQLPVDALHGIGPRQAATLRDYGIHTVARPPTATAPHLSRPPPCRLASHANPRRKPRARWQGGTPADRRLPGSTTIRRTSSTSCPSGRERGSVSTGPSRTDLPLPGTAARRPSPARCAVRRIKLRGRGVAPLAHRSGLTVVVVVSAPRAAARGRVLRSGGPALGDPGQAGGEVAGFPTGNAGSGSHRTGGPQRRQRHDPSRRHPGVA